MNRSSSNVGVNVAQGSLLVTGEFSNAVTTWKVVLRRIDTVTFCSGHKNDTDRSRIDTSVEEENNENEKETLAQIFTDNRYTKKDNIFFSKKFLSCIEKQGFMNNDD